MTKKEPNYDQKLQDLQNELNISKSNRRKFIERWIIPICVGLILIIAPNIYSALKTKDANIDQIPIVIENQKVLKIQQDSTRHDVRRFARWIDNHDACAWRQRFLDSINYVQNKQAHTAMIGLLNKMAKHQGIDPIPDNIYSDLSGKVK
jgi:hypothetical protein